MLTGYWQERGQESKRSTLGGKAFLCNSCRCHHQAAVQVHSSQLFALLTTLLRGPNSHPDTAVLEEMSCVIYNVVSQKLLNHWAGQEKTVSMQWVDGVYTPRSLHPELWWSSKPSDNMQSSGVIAFPTIKRKPYFRDVGREKSLIFSVGLGLGWLRGG